MTFAIRQIQQQDRAGWEPLARGYKEFYKTPTTDAEFDSTWRRLLEGIDIRALVAVDRDEIVGIAHYMFHPLVWGAPTCYLQDLFTSVESRGHGVGTALIRAVAQRAMTHGASRLYWNTHVDNHTARSLYDKLGVNRGFIRYDFPLDVS